MKLVKWKDNPILSPTDDKWQNFQTFNAGAILIDDTIHIFYRAIGEDFISRIGYAKSKDGINIEERSSSPVFEHSYPSPFNNNRNLIPNSGGSRYGAEDPRVVRVNNERKIYMTYNFYDGYNIGVMLTEISIKDLKIRNWRWKNPLLLSPMNGIHKNWVIFPEKIGKRYAILHTISPEVDIEYLKNLRCPEDIESYHCPLPKFGWEMCVKGAAAPPMKTKEGWLLLFHAIGKDGYYKIGAMLLDKKNPTEIISCSNGPILEPKENYEFSGIKPGVVYTTGAVIKNSKLLVYYGASDTYLCVAYANIDEFVESLLEERGCYYDEDVSKKIQRKPCFRTRPSQSLGKRSCIQWMPGEEK